VTKFIFLLQKDVVAKKKIYAIKLELRNQDSQRRKSQAERNFFSLAS